MYFSRIWLHAEKKWSNAAFVAKLGIGTVENDARQVSGATGTECSEQRFDDQWRSPIAELLEAVIAAAGCKLEL